MERISVRARISGRVQGVGFRWWARGEARRLGLDGWVRNRRDGSVEVQAAGPAAAVEELIALCREGPLGAAVTAVERTEAKDHGAIGFDERPTA
jgi:acylphosphatase